VVSIIAVSIVLLGPSKGQPPSRLDWEVFASGVPRAQGSSVPLPRSSAIRKGTIVNIHGRIQSMEPDVRDADGTVYLKVKGVTIFKGSFHGPWNFEWNTSNEIGQSSKLTVAYFDGKSLREVATSTIYFEQAEPISTAVTSKPDGSVSVKVDLEPGAELSAGKCLVDGVPTGQMVSGTGSFALPPETLAGPDRFVSIVVVGKFLKSGQNLGNASSIPISVSASHHLKLLTANSRMTEPKYAFDTMLELSFDTSIRLKPDSLKLCIDGVGHRVENDGNDRFVIDPFEVGNDGKSDIWLEAKSEAGASVYSSKSKLGDSGILLVQSQIEAVMARERKRLQAWKTAFTGIVRVLGNDFGCAGPFGSNSMIPSSNSSRDPAEGTEDRAGCFVDYELVVPYYVDRSLPSEDYRGQVAAKFPEYWSIGSSAHTKPDDWPAFEQSMSKMWENVVSI